MLISQAISVRKPSRRRPKSEIKSAFIRFPGRVRDNPHAFTLADQKHDVLFC
jgi:hypothetical protein